MAAAAAAAAAVTAALAAQNNAKRPLKDLRMLGTEEEFLSWEPRLAGRMRVLRYDAMLNNANALPEMWPAGQWESAVPT